MIVQLFMRPQLTSLLLISPGIFKGMPPGVYIPSSSGTPGDTGVYESMTEPVFIPEQT